MAILFVSGINDRSVVGVTLDKKGKLGHLIDGNCSILRRMSLPGVQLLEVTIFGKGVVQRMPAFDRKPSLVFNQISDADTHQGALERCAELCDAIGAPVINHPRAVLRTSRDQVSELLQGIPGVRMPKTVRCAPASPEQVFELAAVNGIGEPFILRLAGDHGGKSMVRISATRDLERLHAFPFDGRDFYLTEYVDSSDDSGMYHRQRLVVIDGEPLLRGALYDKQWIVHGASRYFMLKHENWDDDRKRSEWMEAEIIPPLRGAIGEMTRRLKLDMYGIDCNMAPDGHMVVFEANANMNILTNDHAALIPRIRQIEQHIRELIGRRSGERLGSPAPVH